MKKRFSAPVIILRVLLILGLLACLALLIIASIPKWQDQAGFVSKPIIAAAVPVSDIRPVEPGSGKININTATLDELCALYGIGTAKANAILAYREQNGPFHYPQDIIYVSGIGETIYENNKDLIGI